MPLLKPGSGRTPLAGRHIALAVLLFLAMAVLVWRYFFWEDPNVDVVAEAGDARFVGSNGKKVVALHGLTYRAGDGSAIPFDVYAPEDYKSVPYPILVWIHGGGWRIGDKSNSLSVGYATLAARLGFVAFNINYRLDTDQKRAPYPAATDDIAAFVTQLHDKLAQYNANEQTKVSIGGHSAGGHLALFQAEEPASALKFACVIDVSGVVDLTARDFPETLEPFLNAFAPTAAVRLAASPLGRVDKFAARSILLVHAQDDPVVPFTQTATLMRELRSKAPAVSVSTYFPGAGGHDLYTQAVGPDVSSFLLAHCR